MWRYVTRSVIVIVFGFGFVSPVKPVLGDSWHLTVRGGDVDLRETPLVLELKEPMPAGVYIVDSPSREGTITAQVFEENGGRRLGVVLPRVDARRNATFTLVGPKESDGATQPGISFETHGSNLKIMLDHRLLTEYQLGVGNKPFFSPINRADR